MRRYVLRAALTGLVGLLGASVVAAPAFAHGKGPRPEMRGVNGMVTEVSSGSLQIQTRRGTTVTVTLNSSTHVIREVTGSSADLSEGTVVDLHAARGQTAVAHIHVNAPGTALRAPKRTRSGRKPTHTRPDGQAQVVSVGDTTITVRYADGATATYPLSSSLLVIKDVPGALGDLAIGQMVSVSFNRGTMTAARVVILNA